eukprot:bmy_08123T0
MMKMLEKCHNLNYSKTSVNIYQIELPKQFGLVPVVYEKAIDFYFRQSATSNINGTAIFLAGDVYLKGEMTTQIRADTSLGHPPEPPVGVREAQLGSGLGSGPVALERNLSDLQLQGPVEAAGDLEADCYRAPCSESREEWALQHFTKEKLLPELEGKLCVFESVVTVRNKEVELSHLALAACIHQSQPDHEHILSLERRVVELQQTPAQKDQALGKLEQSFRLMEGASYDGTLLWKVTSATRRCHESACGRTVSLFSPAFYTAKYGYKLCLRLYLNGDGTGKRTHLSLFIVIMRGEYDALLPWPFQNKVTFMLLDQNNCEHSIDAFRPDLNSASFQRPQSETSVASGCPLFFPLDKLQSPKHAYVKDDTMFLKCIVETNA